MRTGHASLREGDLLVEPCLQPGGLTQRLPASTHPQQVDDSDYYILVSPQNVVGGTIMTALGEHVRTRSSTL